MGAIVDCREPQPVVLQGELIRLDPLQFDDAAELHRIMSNPEAFGSGYPFERAHTCLAETEDFLARRIGDAGTTYAVRLRDLAGKTRRGRLTGSQKLTESQSPSPATGSFCGVTSLTEVDVRNEKVHLGHTFYGREFWGSKVNAGTKRLLLGYIFEECGFGRVKIQCDIRNTRSIRAIERLGARREGILRRDIRREDGTWRDTVVFSILAEEWPRCRANLDQRLAQ